jgi:alkaline phosphatase D
LFSEACCDTLSIVGKVYNQRNAPMNRPSLFLRTLLVASLALLLAPSAFAQHLGMGFRVGEVTQTSAIVWTRVTRNQERNGMGYRDPRKREPRQAEYVPSKVKVTDREGAMPGAPGKVRVIYGVGPKLAGAHTRDWVAVKAENDYTHQFLLKDLKPGTEYHLRVELQGTDDTRTGSFRTPQTKDKWQDVTFTVVTGQSYWDLDDKQGYHIYPAMAKLKPHFLVPTGDTVYLDSEAPRARTVELARYHWHRMYSLPRHIEFHRHVPGYWEVDDHDSWCNDCWPTMTAKWMNPLTFKQGFAIYREQVPMGKLTYRTVRWGKGLQVWFVEGRLYRSSNRAKDGPDKTIWGKEQLAWLQKTILESDADFKVLVSPTPIVGPDRTNKGDNHSNKAFAHEGNLFRNWTKENKLTRFFVCCGDRHWQYVSIDPKTGLREFSCGPASDVHAGGAPREQPDWQIFRNVKGGFLSVHVFREKGIPTISFRHHDVHGKVVNDYKLASVKE